MMTIVFGLSFGQAAFADSETELVHQQTHKNIIKSGPLDFLLGVPNLGYERALNDSMSFAITAAVGISNAEGTTTTAAALEPELRFYLSQRKRAPEGFYVGPIAGLASGSASLPGASANVGLLGGGGELGYQWLLGKSDAFVIDLNAGFLYYTILGEVTVDGFGSQSASLTGLEPILDFSLGYAF